MSRHMAEQVPVGHLHALRCRRGPRRVLEVRESVARERLRLPSAAEGRSAGSSVTIHLMASNSGGRRLAVLELGTGAGVGEEERGPGVAGHRLEPGQAAPHDRDRDGRDTRVEASEEGLDELQARRVEQEGALPEGPESLERGPRARGRPRPAPGRSRRPAPRRRSRGRRRPSGRAGPTPGAAAPRRGSTSRSHGPSKAPGASLGGEAGPLSVIALPATVPDPHGMRQPRSRPRSRPGSRRAGPHGAVSLAVWPFRPFVSNAATRRSRASGRGPRTSGLFAPGSRPSVV